jgi:hypothetical protein
MITVTAGMIKNEENAVNMAAFETGGRRNKKID